jgi:hypothetical protein
MKGVIQMLKFQPSQPLIEARKIVDTYKERITILNSNREELQKEKSELQNLYETALLKEELGEKVDIQSLLSRIEENERKMTDTGNRLNLLSKALDPENITSTLPKIAELLRTGEKECRDFHSQCEQEISIQEQKLLEAKVAYLSILEGIGRIRGMDLARQKELYDIKTSINRSPDRPKYPELSTYQKSWVIKEGELFDAFSRGLWDKNL